MTGSVALDVVIGLVFIYLLYSLLASLIQEIIATKLSFRAKILEKAIVRMLDSTHKDTSHSGFAATDRLMGWIRLLTWISGVPKESLSEQFYEHPLVKNLAEDKWHNKPSYLKASNFSATLIDLLRGPDVKAGSDQRGLIESTIGSGTVNITSVKSTENDSPSKIKIDSTTKRLLSGLWVDAQGDVEKFKEMLEQWFDETMERATGWYKKYSQVSLFFVGMVIAVMFNVDSIQIVQKLSKDPKVREQLVQQASAYVKEHPALLEELRQRQEKLDKDLRDRTEANNADSIEIQKSKYEAQAQYEKKRKRLDSLENAVDDLIKSDIQDANDLLALGWRKECKKNCHCEECKIIGFNGWSSIIGWILTALALSLGAPFWYDLLNKLMKLRASVQTSAPKTTVASASNQASLPKINRVG
ncbi:MAG: hypothetical protein AB7O48_14865 [Cyclobacteriaceae bacterium]